MAHITRKNSWVVYLLILHLTGLYPASGPAFGSESDSNPSQDEASKRKARCVQSMAEMDSRGMSLRLLARIHSKRQPLPFTLYAQNEDGTGQLFRDMAHFDEIYPPGSLDRPTVLIRIDPNGKTPLEGVVLDVHYNPGGTSDADEEDTEAPPQDPVDPGGTDRSGGGGGGAGGEGGGGRGKRELAGSFSFRAHNGAPEEEAFPVRIALAATAAMGLIAAILWWYRLPHRERKEIEPIVVELAMDGAEQPEPAPFKAVPLPQPMEVPLVEPRPAPPAEPVFEAKSLPMPVSDPVVLDLKPKRAELVEPPPIDVKPAKTFERKPTDPILESTVVEAEIPMIAKRKTGPEIQPATLAPKRSDSVAKIEASRRTEVAVVDNAPVAATGKRRIERSTPEPGISSPERAPTRRQALAAAPTSSVEVSDLAEVLLKHEDNKAVTMLQRLAKSKLSAAPGLPEIPVAPPPAAPPKVQPPAPAPQNDFEKIRSLLAARHLPGQDAAGEAAFKGKTFFGIPTDDAKTIVFVIDASQSMRKQLAFQYLQLELQRAVRELPETSLFTIIAFGQGYNHWRDSMVMASKGRGGNKASAAQWIGNLRASHRSTQMAPPMAAALALKPEVIFLLTDGVPDDGAALRRVLGNPGSTRIHTIGFEGNVVPSVLKQIADAHGGRFELFKRPAD